MLRAKRLGTSCEVRQILDAATCEQETVHLRRSSALRRRRSPRRGWGRFRLGKNLWVGPHRCGHRRPTRAARGSRSPAAGWPQDCGQER